MSKLSILAICLMLAGCGGSENATEKAIEKPVSEAKAIIAEKSDFKPVEYIDPRSEQVCKSNGGFKGCYGFAFECNDGYKTKVDKVSCEKGQYVEDKEEKLVPSVTAKSDNTMKTPQDVCKEMARMAGIVMESRQAGVPMSKSMDLAGDSELLQALISDAYRRSQFTTEEYKQKAVNEFKDYAYSACWRNLKK